MPVDSVFASCDSQGEVQFLSQIFFKYNEVRGQNNETQKEISLLRE